MTHNHLITRATVLGAAILAFAAVLPAQSQTANVYTACYIRSTGTVYRIKTPTTPQQCGTTTKKGTTTSDVEFSWTDFISGEYVPVNGVRNATDGFAVTGTLGVGSIPATGFGTRLMWYPGKASFFAGFTDAQYGPVTGNGSIALGMNPAALGDGAIALGTSTRAQGHGSVAISGGVARGYQSFAAMYGETATAATHAVAIGSGAQVNGSYSVALGFKTSANGNNSTVLGTNAADGGKNGAFVWGDASPGITVVAAADNQFVARASRFWFGNSSDVTATLFRFIETSTGAYLSSGGTWTNSSDSAKKTGFRAVDGEDVLAKVAAMPVQTWSYRDEDSTVKHLGPTAQDFKAAFNLGQAETAIATVDADGVSLAAIKALVDRSDKLARANAELRAEMATLSDRMLRLEALLAVSSNGSTARR
jgi:Chaperone of endosialidase/YadA head domain repeat (2 copies)